MEFIDEHAQVGRALRAIRWDRGMSQKRRVGRALRLLMLLEFAPSFARGHLASRIKPTSLSRLHPPGCSVAGLPQLGAA